MPTFRPATNSDADAIRTLVFGVLAEYGLSPDPSGTDADLRDIEASYHSAGGTFDLLVDTNGFILGTVALCRVTDSECELRKMYLVREARGKGYGRRLLEQGIESSKKLGFTRITLETASVLKEAVAMYQQRGFRSYTPEHLSPRCDAAYFLDLAHESA